jgi:CHAT domain-containing protein
MAGWVALWLAMPLATAAEAPAVVTTARGDVQLLTGDEAAALPPLPVILAPGQSLQLADGAMAVVLSACESSLAVEADGEDGEGSGAISINGLAAQFRRAGVETLVGTLWKVDDAATLALMTGFYEELDRGADVGRSFQAAQQRMLASHTHAHPYFWAGFVTVGDWR